MCTYLDLWLDFTVVITATLFPLVHSHVVCFVDPYEVHIKTHDSELRGQEEADEK